MIKVETCRGCGRIIFVGGVAPGLTVRLDSEPCTADEAVQALMGGRALWRVTPTSVQGARPAELAALRQRGVTEGPRIHPEHRCTAAVGAQTVRTAQEAQADPKGAQTGAQRFPADRSTRRTADRPTHPSGARSAGPRRSEVTCARCRRPVTVDGPELYMAIELGAHVVWAMHADCPQA